MEPRPNPLIRNRKLPYSFLDPLPSNDCEFVVDVLKGDGSLDVFPTKLVAEKAEEIVNWCMERGVDGAQTLGAVSVGPKKVLVVVMMRKGWGRGGGGLVGLLGTGNSSGLLTSFVEDG